MTQQEQGQEQEQDIIEHLTELRRFSHWAPFGSPLCRFLC